ncbi:UNVERIFIED_CONTAM: hypothetical protein HDU68_009516 [Siphonaria sp. JEL0065]|nr:hypothetical protein HDU68_009516 [Siphonaria sp. JEL0065]
MEALETQPTKKEQNPLTAIKVKLMQLHESLAGFLEMPLNVPWPVVLGQFNSLIAKYESITNELQQLVYLKHLVTGPVELPLFDPDSIPRVVLRTRLDQELLDAEDAIRAAHALVCKRAPEKTTNALDQVALKAELRGWANLVDAHDTVANHAAKHLEDVEEETLKELKSRLPDDGTSVSAAHLQGKLDETVRWLNIGK